MEQQLYFTEVGEPKQIRPVHDGRNQMFKFERSNGFWLLRTSRYGIMGFGFRFGFVKLGGDNVQRDKTTVNNSRDTPCNH